MKNLNQFQFHRLIGSSAHRLIGSSAHRLIGSSAHRLIGFCVSLIAVSLPAQDTPKIPDSVASLGLKYDEARVKALSPLVTAFADQLKKALMPEMARMGKAAVAVEFGESADGLVKAPVPVLPREGAPFSPEAWAALSDTEIWKTFSTQFTAAETSLNDSYKRALEREKAAFQAKGNAYGMLAVENEVKRVEVLADGTGAPAVATPAAGVTVNPATTKGKRLKRAELNEIEKQLLGGLWVDTKRPTHQFYFREDGSITRVWEDAGKRLTNTWLLRDDGVVLWGERSFVITEPGGLRLYVPGVTPLEIHDFKLDPAGADPGK